MKKIAAAVIAIAVIGAIAAYRIGKKDNGASNTEAQPAFVRVATVEANTTIRDSIEHSLSIEAVSRVLMTPRVTGRLKELHVKQGDFVTAGTIVATLEHDQQDALIVSTAAALASARADKERARAEMANAKTESERYERLVKEGFSTQQQYDSIKTSFASARASYDAAAARERQAAAELGRVESEKDDYIMRAPIDGTILTDHSLTPGAMISPSSPIIDIADLRRLKATLRIPELKIFSVTPGMSVLLRFDALPDEEFRGDVSRIDPYVDPSTRTSAVEIELDNEAYGNRLRPGMFGTASIIEREFRDAIVVPESAIVTTGGHSRIFVEEDGVAREKSIDVGLRQGGNAQITSGLVSGDRAIVFGGSNLSDGDKVTVQ